MTGQFVLGVDGGKTKTVCLLAREDGKVVGAGRSGSSDKYDVPVEQAITAIVKAVEQAAQSARIQLPVNAACFGLAGADWPEDVIELEQQLGRRQLAQQIQVKNDMPIALHANADYGVAVSIGTHTAAAVRTPQGEEWHAGWFAVEGPGGVTAGHRALWAVFHAEDGRGDPTALTDLVLQKTGKAHPLDLLYDLSQGKLDDAFLASLAPLLFEAHDRFADPVAAKIIMDLGHGVARWVNGLLKRFDMEEGQIPVVLTGGLLKSKGNLLLDTIGMAVHARFPQASLSIAQHEPVLGAVLYAFSMTDLPITAHLKTRLIESIPPKGFFKTA